MVTNNVFEAAYVKAKGFGIGKAVYNKDKGLVDIELKGDEEKIQRCINNFHTGGQVDAKIYADEVGFIQYLVKQRAR